MIPGVSEQNETYIGQRLLFQRAGEVEVGLAETVGGRDALRILKQAFVGAFLIGLGATTFGVLAAFAVSAATRDRDAGAWFLTMSYVLPWVWIALVLFVPRTEVLSDWHLLLDGRAPIAETAYGVVYRSLTADRQIPAVVAPRRVPVGAPVAGVRNMLCVSIGRYSSYISVFAFGNDLYLGWTLWRKQLPFMVVLRWIGSLFGGHPGYSGVLEMEPIKAMRESVHNALRQGIEASVAGRAIPLVETFGYEVPVESAPGVGPSGALPLVTVARRVEVFSAEDGGPVGYAEPGVTYQVVRDDAEGLVVRDQTGVAAVLKDRSAVQW